MNAGAAALTPNQQARRQRVIRAAIHLASEGGYDAVQMRDVAAAADVALGTVYRYFSSKDHLLTAGLSEWTAQWQARVQGRALGGATMADQLVAVLREACRAIEHRPRLTAAMIQALSSRDPNVAVSARAVTGQIRTVSESVLDALDPEVRVSVVDVIRHVWYSTLSQWANGFIELTRVGDELERAVRLVLAGVA